MAKKRNMRNNENSKNISTTVPVDVFKVLENKIQQTGMNRSAYLKSLIYADLDMVNDSKILKQEKKSEGILSKLQKLYKKTDELSETKTDEIQHRRMNNKVGTNKWMISRSVITDWGSLELTKTGQIRITSNGNISKFDVNEWYVIRELALTDDFLVSEFNELHQFLRGFLNFNKSTLNRAIWNIWIGNFEEIVNTIERSVRSLNYTVDKNRLYINNELQNVTVSEMREILGCLYQKGYSEREVLTLSKSYNHINPLLFRIVCMNYDNPNFTRLLKTDAGDFVENNPSKRRNIIRIGGGEFSSC